MNRIWKFTPWVPYEIGSNKLVQACSVLFDAAHWKRGASIGQFKSEAPDVQLNLTLDECSLDCFMWESWIFVSERLRNTMALQARAIQYFDIDASGSAPLARSMHYKIMNIPFTEDVSEPARSDFMLPEMYPGGPTGRLSKFARKIFVRSDAKPRHQLFHDHFFGEPFCTDELALKILRAGCTGVRFLDPTQMIGDRIKFRTLRGVEEEAEWDAAAKAPKSDLVEVIVQTDDGPKWTAVPRPRERQEFDWGSFVEKAQSWAQAFRH
jgi:hypothetical protein